MRKNALILAALACAAAVPAAYAASLETQLEERLLGAWIVLGTELRSNCDGSNTGNRVNGTFVQSRGRFGFKPGELAKVHRVDANRSRLDLTISLAEPILAERQDGPFTLYDELNCRVELEIEMPRETIREKNVAAIEARLKPVFVRFATHDDARAHEAYNGREREGYPEDYERTLAAHAVWRAEQINASVEESLARNQQDAQRVSDRIQSDPQYLDGFARGVEEGRTQRNAACGLLVSRLAAVTSTPSRDETPEQRRWRQGRDDGRTLALALDALGKLPSCYVEVPRS